MRVVGIVAEYNPFHNGHAYHLEQAIARAQSDYCVVALSGSFVQRAETAVADKFTRTRWALQCGADLVLEIPAVYATGSAERFARGAVGVLAAAGVVTHLCFGSETDDLFKLQDVSLALERESEPFRHAMQLHLKQGRSFPAARYRAFRDLGADTATLNILSSPNSILALEYLRQLRRYAPDIQPICIPRIGSYHDQALSSGSFPSAAAIRAALLKGDTDALSHVPAYVRQDLLNAAANWPKTQRHAEDLTLYALRSMTKEQLKALPDVQEGFENVLYHAAQKSFTFSAFLESVKSKRYTLARCRRIALCALLNVSGDVMRAAMASPQAPYLRVLGFRESAQALISQISTACTAPMLLKHKDTQTCGETGQALLRVDRFATDVYFQCAQTPSPVRDFAQPPVRL